MSAGLVDLLRRLGTGETTLSAAAAPELTANEQAQWLNNPLKNPKTNKALNPKALTGLFIGFRDKYATLSPAECQAWMDKTRPPPSMIAKGMEQFNASNQVLKSYFESQCSVVSAAATSSSSQPRRTFSLPSSSRNMNLLKKIYESPSTAQELIVQKMTLEKRFLTAMALMFEDLGSPTKMKYMKVFLPNFDKVSNFELCMGSSSMKKMSYLHHHHCPLSVKMDDIELTGRVYFNLKSMNTPYPIGIELQDIPGRPKTHLRVLLNKNAASPIDIDIYQTQLQPDTAIPTLHDDLLLVFLVKFYREFIQNLETIQNQRAFVNQGIEKNRATSPDTLRRNILNIALPSGGIRIHRYVNATFSYDIPSPLRNPERVIPKQNYTYTPLRNDDDDLTGEIQVDMKHTLNFQEDISCYYFKSPASPTRQSRLRIFITLDQTKGGAFMNQYSFETVKSILSNLYAILHVEDRHFPSFKKVTVVVKTNDHQLTVFRNAHVEYQVNPL